MTSEKHLDPTIDEIAAFVQAISRLTLNSRVQQRFAGTTNLVSPSELSALRALERHGRLTYRELAGRMNLDPTTVSRLASHLLDLGLVSRDADEADRRKLWLALTPDGASILAEVESVYLEYYEVAISDWTSEERDAARTVLAKLRESLLSLKFDDRGRAVGVAHPAAASASRGETPPSAGPAPRRSTVVPK